MLKLALPAAFLGSLYMTVKTDATRTEDQENMQNALQYEQNGLLYVFRDADKISVSYQELGASEPEQEILYDFSLGLVTVDHVQDNLDHTMRFNDLADPAAVNEVLAAACIIVTQQAPSLLEYGEHGTLRNERKTYARKAQAFADKRCPAL